MLDAREPDLLHAADAAAAVLEGHRLQSFGSDLLEPAFAVDAGEGYHWAVAVDTDGETVFSMKVINDESQILLIALTPYGDAVFNHRKMPLLLAELDRLPAACGGDWVPQARELCQVVERGTHLYLWFIGD